VNHSLGNKKADLQGKEKKRKDYTFRRQFNEKPSIIPGCPGRLAGQVQKAVVVPATYSPKPLTHGVMGLWVTLRAEWKQDDGGRGQEA